MSEKQKRIGIGVLIGICAVLFFFFILGTERPYRHLQADNVASISLKDSGGRSEVTMERAEDIRQIITKISEMKTYNNVMLKDVPSNEYQFIIQYNDGRKRAIKFALPMDQGKVKDTKNLCMTINGRWYRIKIEQAEEVLKLYSAKLQS